MMVSMLHWPFSGHVVLPLHEHPASVSGGGRAICYFLFIECTAKGKPQGMLIEYFVEPIDAGEVLVYETRKTLPMQILTFKEKGVVNHNTLSDVFSRRG